MCGWCLLNPSPALLSCQGRGCQRTFPSPRLAAGRAGCGQAVSPWSWKDDSFEGLVTSSGCQLHLGSGLAARAREAALLRRVQTLSAPKLDLNHLFSSVDTDVRSFHPHTQLQWCRVFPCVYAAACWFAVSMGKTLWLKAELSVGRERCVQQLGWLRGMVSLSFAWETR